MSNKSITIYPRTQKSLNTLRTNGQIPGILYGQSLEKSIPIQIKTTDLLSLIGNIGHTTTFILNYEGTDYTCILRDYQTDRLHTNLLHVDFQYVKPGEVIKLQVPVDYQGLEHVRARKQVLEKFVNKIVVKGNIDILPEAFHYDVGALTSGAKILAKDITLPSGTISLTNPETIIATIQ